MAASQSQSKRKSMKTTFITALIALSMASAASALDTPRDLLEKIFGKDRKPAPSQHDTVEHCGRNSPHGPHHWDDSRGHHHECPGTRANEPRLEVAQCRMKSFHGSHIWEDKHGHQFKCPGSKPMATVSCPQDRPHGSHVWQDQRGQQYACPGVNAPSYPKVSCFSHKRHSAHVWENDRGQRFICSGHE